MKGLVLSGGKGTRLRPLTFSRAKQLIPIANKPALFYVIDDLVDAGIHDIGVVISPETGEEVKAALTDRNRFDARFHFVPQEQPLGLAHAVKCARSFLADEPFVMCLGDNLLSTGLDPLLDAYEPERDRAVVLLTPVDQPERFGVAELGAGGQVVQLVEKPKDPPSNLALVGVYLFDPVIHQLIDQLEPSWRGEYEITDALQGLLDQGYPVKARRVDGWWKDTGQPGDLLDANRLVLSQLTRDIQGHLEAASIKGPVVIDRESEIIHSTIRGPAHIGPGVTIKHSDIGPYTSIGRGCELCGSQIEYSIVQDQVRIVRPPGRLHACVIGRGTVIRGGQRSPDQTLTLVLGDQSQVNL